MADFDGLSLDPDADADEPGTGDRPPVLRLGAQTMDAARGVNRHHELRTARRYAELAQSVEAPTDVAGGSMDASATSA